MAFLLFALAFAAEITTSKILLIADSAQVHLTSQKEGSAANPSACNCEDAQIEVKDEWTTIRVGSTTKTLVFSLAPQAEMRVFLSEGSILSERVLGVQHLRVLKGKIKVAGGQGELRAHAVKGEITLNAYDGVVNLDSGFASVNAADGKGKMDALVFQASSEVKNHQGGLGWQQQTGQLKVVALNGEGTVDASKTNVQLSSIKGRLEVTSTEGALQTVFNQPADLVLKSGSGKISVQVAQTASPAIWAWSGAGEVAAPAFLKTQRDAYGKTARGRFPAAEAKGSITIRTSEGSINLY